MAVPSGSTILVSAIMSHHNHEYITHVQCNVKKLELTSSSLSTINITIIRLAMFRFNENDSPEFPVQWMIYSHFWISVSTHLDHVPCHTFL
jgi:hypothetical protein